MFHGTKYILLAIVLITACSGSKYRKADCFDCVAESQSWKKFSWAALEGTWKGSVEAITNDVNAKNKVRKEESVEIHFVNGKDFFTNQKITSCGAFPGNAVVMMGLAYQGASAKSTTAYEVFAEAVDDKVSYGRVTLTNLNGQKICEYRAIGGYLSMNRLAYPSLRFSERLTPNGRVLASGATPEYEVNFDFLNFDTTMMKRQDFANGGRRPASVVEQDRPPLFFRVFQISRKVNGAYSNGEWTGTKEYLYRLWKI